MFSPTQLSLRSLLGVDAATCAAMGGLLVLVSGDIAGVTQISAPLLFWAGLLLFPVAVFMALSARAAQVPGWAVNLVVLGNLAWVLASLVLPFAGVIAPNTLGWAFLLIQAAAVVVLSWLEWRASANQVPAGE
ncbi:hypothetical protein [Roseibium sp.]|uniref:hypothetical protein n=1 Tax=Roseibium sp. TaxID=1936156 RepID=UPI003D0C52C1